MKSILDKSFVYRDSAHTNIRLTFARIRREQAAAKPVPLPEPRTVIALLPKNRKA